MAIMNETLQTVADALKGDAAQAGMVRMRGGMARGVSWLEISGRDARDAAWYEARFHARNDGRLQGGLLAYQPLSRGGRTIVVGEQSYDETTEATTQALIDVARDWIALVSERATT